MGNRMKQRWCRLGLVSLLAWTLFGGMHGLGAGTGCVEAALPRRGTGWDAAHYAEAETLLTQALREAEQGQADDARVALAANHLGLLYHDQGRLTEAESLYARALGIWEAHWAPSTGCGPAALNNLAEIAHAKGDWTGGGTSVRAGVGD